VCVLAGGKSSRFGADKLTAPFRGKFLISNILDELTDFPEVILITKFPFKFLPLVRTYHNLKVVVESFSEFSPIYGIYTGLRSAKFGKVIFVPGDVPLLKGELVRKLTLEVPPAVVVKEKRFHSLFTVISKFSLPKVEEFLRSGRHKLRELHGELNSRPIPFEKFQHLDFRGDSLKNVNRQEDYIEAVCR